MGSIRSILWIGRGEQLAAAQLAQAPTLDVVWERDVEGALALPLQGFDAIALDATSVENTLLGLVRLRRRRRCPPLVVWLAAEQAARVPDLLAAGAADVVLCPAPGNDAASEGSLREHLEKRVRAGARPPDPSAPSPAAADATDAIIGRSAEMAAVLALVERASRFQATVLLSGETGTGKELLARAIHYGGPRASGAFVAVNCAAFADTLLESELFGHVRGSFTGAERDRKGLFEAADRGTLFLDEVSETSRPFQAKLLRVLQERELRPLGSASSRRIDVRVVAATNRDLWREALAGRFREDLYYRLAVFPIHVPPLRERPTDIQPLAEHFLALHAHRERSPRSRLAADALQLLQSYRWPGNVRELENEIHRALILAERGETLAPERFSERLFGILEPVEASVEPGESLRETLARIEAWLIRRALAANGGRRTQTARGLGITREGLYKKMKRLNVE